MLSPSQLKILRARVDQSSITISTLRDDLLDHLCCSVESKINNGEMFDDAVTQSLHELAPEGLAKLEQETIFLLNSKYIVMKKIMYLTGFATTVCMTMGLTMKLLHMPGGEQLSNFGFLSFVLVFVPMITYKQWRVKTARPWYDNLKIIFGLISAVGVGFSVFFKIMMVQLDLSANLLLASVTIFSFGFLPCLFYSMYSREAVHQ